MTTIDEAKTRLCAAEYIHAVYDGDHSLDVCHVGDYVIVSDGVDRWITETIEYESILELLISEILDGEYDSAIRDSEFGGYNSHDFYTMFCSRCDAIYSRVGSPSDPAVIDELPATDEQKDAIKELLGIQ